MISFILFRDRFKDDNYPYLPKPYQVDKYRHQKHLIEDDPKYEHMNNEGYARFDDGQTDNDERKMHQNEENHLQLFPTVVDRNFDVGHDKSSEQLLKDIHESQTFLSSMINLNADHEKIDSTEKRRVDDSQKFLSQMMHLPRENEEHAKLSNEAISQLIGAPKNIMDANVDNGGWHDSFMDKIRPDTSAMVPGFGSIFVGSSSQDDKAQNSQQLTPVLGPMNPEINDEQRLSEFNTYARRKNNIQDIESEGDNQNLQSEDKYHDSASLNMKDPELAQFVSEIMHNTNGKEIKLPNDVQQLQYLKHVQESALKVLGSEYKELQVKVMNKYVQADTDKLDGNDKKELNRLGYSEGDISDFNKQVINHKRNSDDLENVGIEVNGKKIGNVALLADK